MRSNKNKYYYAISFEEVIRRQKILYSKYKGDMSLFKNDTKIVLDYLASILFENKCHLI